MPSEMMLKQYYRAYRTSKWVRDHFTYLGQVVLIIMLFAAAFGIDTTATTTYQLFALLLVLLVFAFLNSCFMQLELSATRRLPRYFTVGEKAYYSILLENKKNISYTNLALIEQLLGTPPNASELANWFQLSNKPIFKRSISFRRWRSYFARSRGGVIPELPVPLLPTNRSAKNISIEIEFTPLRRGKLIYEGIFIACPDRLGLFRGLTFIPASQSCLVLPRRYPVAPLKLAGARKFQSGGISLANSVGDSSEFMTLREYREGDPLNRIHWKSYARRGELVAKEYQDEYFSRQALVLDTFAGDLSNDYFEAAVSVAASVCMSERTTDSLLDLMFVEEKAHRFTSGRGVDHMPHIQEILASVQSSSASFKQLEKAVCDHIQLCSSVVCVLMSWDTERQALIRLLQKNGMPLAVFLIHNGSILTESIENPPELFYLIDYHTIAADLAVV
jgi:uncharacterized protein (DUF58 family)